MYKLNYYLSCKLNTSFIGCVVRKSKIDKAGKGLVYRTKNGFGEEDILLCTLAGELKQIINLKHQKDRR
jgi:hypothetical protein